MNVNGPYECKRTLNGYCVTRNLKGSVYGIEHWRRDCCVRSVGVHKNKYRVINNIKIKINKNNI